MKKLLVFALVLATTAVFGLVQLNTYADKKGDCSANSVVTCGTYSLDTLRSKYNKEGSVRNIFSYFGITKSTINDLTVKNGSVTKDGKVMVGNKEVASGAVTAGRQHISGKSGQYKKTVNGTSFWTRKPSVSFKQSSLSAYVFFKKDGTFAGAVIKDCGNPVKATNKVPKKSAACDNLTSKKLSRTKFEFNAKASTKNGAKIQGYRIDFGDGHDQYYKTGSKSKTVTHTYSKPGTYKVKMTVNTDVGNYVTSSNCATTVKVEKPTPPPKVELPVVSCDGLDVDKKSRTAYDFTVKATAKNTKVTSYTFDFGDGKKETVKTDATTKTVSHDYSKAGKYTVQVTLTTLDKQVKDEKCSATVNVAPAPVAACDGLDATVTDRTNYKLTAKASAANGATIKDYTFVVTDENGKKVVNKTTSNNTLSGELEEGTYTAKVTVHTSLGDRASENCTAQITIAPPNKIVVCDLETKEVVTINEKDFDETKHSKNLDDCKEVVKQIEVCDTTTGKTVTIDEKDFDDSRYSKDFSDCETPAELPETGAGGISAALGLGSIATAVTYYVASRRNLLSSLLGQ